MIIYQSNVKDFTDILTDTINRLPNNNSTDIFMLGDFNINYADNRNPARKNLKDLESLTGLKQLITETTRFARNGSIIDLIYTNSDGMMNAGTLNLNVSDHEAIFVTRKKAKERYKVVESFGRSYTKYNKSEFHAQLRNCNWDVLNSLTDVNEYWNVIEENIKNTVDHIFCPLRRMKIKDRGDSWITKELIELLHDKDRIRKKAKNSGRREDSITSNLHCGKDSFMISFLFGGKN